MTWLQEHGFEQTGSEWKRDIGGVVLAVSKMRNSRWLATLFDTETDFQYGCTSDTPEEAVSLLLSCSRESVSRLSSVLSAVESVIQNNISFEEVGRVVHE